MDNTKDTDMQGTQNQYNINSIKNVSTTRHINWKSRKSIWRAMRDSNSGESAIKFSNELYLPMPAGFTKIKSSPSLSNQTFSIFQDRLENQYNPNYHQNPAYESYKTRATFPEIVNFTLRGLLGLALKQTPLIKLNSQTEHLGEFNEYPDILHFYYKILEEVLLTGKANVLIDLDETGKLRPIFYKAEDLVNWTRKNQTTKFTDVLLIDDSDKDTLFEDEDKTQVSEYLYLTIENGLYTAYRINDDDTVIDRIVPSYKGKTLSYIPFISIGSSDLVSDNNRIPLAGIARIAIQLYQLDADLRQAEYLTCNPTLVITGADEDSAPTVVGSSVVLTLPDTNSKAYYTTTDTSALQHISKRMIELYESSLKQGSTLLGGSKDVAESGEALRIRQESTNATLISIIENVGIAIKRILDIMSEWSSVNQDCVFEPSKEFTSYTMTPAEQQALVQSWQAGAITHNTLLENFAKAGILPDGVTPIEEYDAIQQERKLDITSDNVDASGNIVNSKVNKTTEPTLKSGQPNLAIKKKDIVETSSEISTSQE